MIQILNAEPGLRELLFFQIALRTIAAKIDGAADCPNGRHEKIGRLTVNVQRRTQDHFARVDFHQPAQLGNRVAVEFGERAGPVLHQCGHFGKHRTEMIRLCIVGPQRLQKLPAPGLAIGVRAPQKYGRQSARERASHSP